jgi:cytochrome c oxidase subunit 2
MMRSALVIWVILLFGCRPAAAPPNWNSQIPLKVIVAGDAFRWHLRYPGADGLLDTGDDIEAWRNVHVPANRDIELILTSRDYVYTVYFPHIELLEAAVPNDPYVIKLTTGAPATHDLLGAQMCNYTHEKLIGELVVLSAVDFETWLQEKTGATP